jgi:hypothetical protein
MSFSDVTGERYPAAIMSSSKRSRLFCSFGIGKPGSDRLDLGARLGQIGRPDTEGDAQLDEALDYITSTDGSNLSGIA